MSQVPNWVARKPERYLERLRFEAEMLSEAFPAFRLMTEGGVLFAEGAFFTLSRNRYSIRAYYPKDYPYSAPQAFVMDEDVASYCSHSGEGFHTYGFQKEIGGLRLCLLDPNDSSGQGWLPDFSVVTILNLAAAWLHAYEVKRVTGEWILPEAH